MTDKQRAALDKYRRLDAELNDLIRRGHNAPMTLFVRDSAKAMAYALGVIIMADGTVRIEGGAR